MKKILGFAVAALLSTAAADASTLFQNCTGTNNVAISTANGSTPSVNGSASCASFTVPAGSTLNSVELFISGDYSLAAVGNSTINFTFTVNTVSGSFSLAMLGEAASGDGQSSLFVFVPSGSNCISGQNWSNATSSYQAQPDTADCATTSGVPLDGGSTYGTVTITGSSSWSAGSAGLLEGGAENFGVSELFTYSTNIPQTVPEPGTLLMIGAGLVGLGFARRKS